MESASAISEAGALGGGGLRPARASMVARELQSVGRRKRIPDRKSRTERVIREAPATAEVTWSRPSTTPRAHRAGPS